MDKTQIAMTTSMLLPLAIAVPLFTAKFLPNAHGETCRRKVLHVFPAGLCTSNTALNSMPSSMPTVLWPYLGTI
jgi:hypothetical protein